MSDAKATSANLLLLRHGQIGANRQGRWHGSTDSPLTWRGRRQARRTGRYLEALTPSVSAVYSSPLTRCRHTAGIVARRLGLEVVVHPDLREYAIGEWEGTSFSELAGQYRFIELATGDHDFAPPGGETLRQVAERMVTALTEIHERHRQESRVLVVSHGAAMGVALGQMLENDPGRWTDYVSANCSLTELVLSPTAYVNFLSSTAHL